MTITYIIQDATNLLYYTENHTIDIANRWTPDFLNAYQFSSLADAENEIDIELFTSQYLIILAVYNK
jgi:hypothetical protein